MQGGQNKNKESFFIALTHEDHKALSSLIEFLKAGNFSPLLAAKMVIKNPEEVNAAIVNGKTIKRILPQSGQGHAGHHLMDATAKILQGLT